ncbi:hypothetical protein HPB47_015842 [Ixodes persulcatus]|uniref:Uncharacterized protein n=1 Tax=Ixodes persulcatus TaxID=34615 RepID=A0AC60QV06_IXOPE|nr:hypothetical protein HPB47_015842 [Ixodes persulcatus]
MCDNERQRRHSCSAVVRLPDLNGDNGRLPPILELQLLVTLRLLLAGSILVFTSKNDVLPPCSATTLYRLLKEMGFEKQKQNRNSMEREEILEAIGKHKAENRKIYFQGGTWVNTGLSRQGVDCSTIK